MFEAFLFFPYFCLLYQEHYLLEFYLLGFLVLLLFLHQNLLNSRVIIKIVVSGILFQPHGFCIRSSYGNQVSIIRYFTFKVTFVAGLVILGILFSNFLVFVFSMVLVTNPVTLDILFPISLHLYYSHFS